jgi:hypothetical protein
MCRETAALLPSPCNWLGSLQSWPDGPSQLASQLTLGGADGSKYHRQRRPDQRRATARSTATAGDARKASSTQGKAPSEEQRQIEARMGDAAAASPTTGNQRATERTQRGRVMATRKVKRRVRFRHPLPRRPVRRKPRPRRRMNLPGQLTLPFGRPAQ